MSGHTSGYGNVKIVNSPLRVSPFLSSQVCGGRFTGSTSKYLHPVTTADAILDRCEYQSHHRKNSLHHTVIMLYLLI